MIFIWDTGAYPELSLADCVVVNLGKRNKATVITTERMIWFQRKSV